MKRTTFTIISSLAAAFILPSCGPGSPPASKLPSEKAPESARTSFQGGATGSPGQASPYSTPWVGATFGTVSPIRIGASPEAYPAGAVEVRRIEEGSPAEKSGLVPGDVVVSCEGQALLGTPDDFIRRIQQTPPGQSLPVEIARQGSRRSLQLLVGEKTTAWLADRAMKKGLEWLFARQTPSGGWTLTDVEDPDYKPEPELALSALALAAVSECAEELRAPYSQKIDKGVAFLLAHLTVEGRVLDPDEAVQTHYPTALTLTALCRLGPEKYRQPVAALRKYLLEAQMKPDDKNITQFDWGVGGWNYYTENTRYSLRVDLSISSVVAEALFAAGVPPGDPAWAQLDKFLRHCQNWRQSSTATADLPGSEQNDGGFFFNARSSKAGVSQRDGEVRFRSYGSMTCDGLRSLLTSGAKPDDPRAVAARRWIERHFTLKENPNFPPQQAGNFGAGILFYYYHGLAKALDGLGLETVATPDGKTRFWAKELVDHLAMLQRKDGSWSNPVNVMSESEPMQATGLALSALATARKYAR